jgi:DNA invertase Pin-like site-specific DNA recombinase
LTYRSIPKRSPLKDDRHHPRAKPLLGYARLGNDRDNLRQARAALRSAGCRCIFEEKGSSGRWDRPELKRLFDRLRKGDTVVVWRLDCLSRSLKDLLPIMMRIAAAGAGFRSIAERINTTTPGGRMMMRMVGALAKFERTMIGVRTIAGLEAARAEGRGAGRPRKLDAATERKIAQNVLSGRNSGAAMARLYNINKGTVSRIVAEHRVGLPSKVLSRTDDDAVD